MMSKQRLDKRWKNFVEIAGLCKENESENTSRKSSRKIFLNSTCL